MDNQSPLKRQGLKQTIYQDLKAKLISCTLPPGTELNELAISEEYGVSRTPVREAISQLEVEGYVRVLPKRGIYISDVSIDDVLQIFETRIEIEPITLRLAFPYLDIQRLIDYRSCFEAPEENLTAAFDQDTDMHLYLIDCCRNQYLIDMMHRLFDNNTRIINATGQNMIKIHNARQEHLEILDSLLTNRTPEKPCELMRKHIETCRSAALRYFSSDQYKRFARDGLQAGGR